MKVFFVAINVIFETSVITFQNKNGGRIMLFLRKFIAVLLLVSFVLFLPLSLILRNAGDILFSAEKVSGLVEEHILTEDIIVTALQTKMAPEISKVKIIIEHKGCQPVNFSLFRASVVLWALNLVSINPWL